LFVCAPVFAKPEITSRAPGEHEHDGLYLRLLSGAGLVRADYGPNVLGAGAMFNVAVGNAIKRNLIVFLEASYLRAFAPAISGGGNETANTLSQRGLGVGMAYYFPRNYYVSSTVGLSQTRLDFRFGDDVTDDMGLGSNLQFGREWWVSRNWGLGVAAQLLTSLTLAAHESDDFENPYKQNGHLSLGFGLAVSATFN
jgi:hypothetical protein